MGRYKASYRGRTIRVQADSYYAAQKKAAALLKARSRDVTVVLLSRPLSTTLFG